jgi:undecaprenyl-diphosphatase
MRVTPDRRLLGLAVAAIGLLAVLTILVRQHARVVYSFDTSVYDALHSYVLTHPTFLSVMGWVTRLGDTLVVAVVDVIAFVICLAMRRPRAAVFVAVAGLSVWGLRLAMSRAVGRPRPVDALWPAEGFSFPSGHTANSFAMGVIVVVTGWSVAGRRVRIALVCVAALAALAIGASRVAGGVHWPTDVLGGWLLALAVCSLTGQIVEKTRLSDR